MSILGNGGKDCESPENLNEDCWGCEICRPDKFAPFDKNTMYQPPVFSGKNDAHALAEARSAGLSKKIDNGFILVNYCGGVYFACPDCEMMSEEYSYKQNDPTMVTHDCASRAWSFAAVDDDRWRVR